MPVKAGKKGDGRVRSPERRDRRRSLRQKEGREKTGHVQSAHAGNGKTKSFQRRPLTEEERKAMEARRARKEKNIREQKLAAAGRISYVKKPLSQRSIICICLIAAALLLGGVGLYYGYITYGQAPFLAGGLALCSMLCSMTALGYGFASFAEHDKNQILARIGIGAGAFLMAVWTGIIIIGLRG